MSDPVPFTTSPAAGQSDAHAGAPLGPFRDMPRLQTLAAPFSRFVKRLIELLKIPPPSTPQVLERIETMERDIVLPIKVAGIAMLLQSFPWIGEASGTLDVPVEYARYFLWVYVA